MCDQASFTAYVESGEMRLLASATDQRWDSAPDVETLSEMGYDIELLSYMGICVPADTDDAIVEKLRTADETAPNDDTSKTTREKCNLTWAYLSGDDYEQIVKDKNTEYGELMK